MTSRRLCCTNCGYEFETEIDCDMHERYCTNEMFVNNSTTSTKSVTLGSNIHKNLTDHGRTYRNLLQQAAERDPAYRKYIGRQHITEPNGLTDAFVKSKRRKQFNGE